MHIRIQIIFLFLLSSFIGLSQSDSTKLFTKRSHIVYGTYSTALSASMIGLYSLWYKDYPKSKFHFFNDNDQWLGMDKFGHAMSGYYISGSITKSLLWAGKSKKMALTQGAIGGLLFLSGIEVLDGYSDQWGFSNGDMAANILGIGLYGVQEALWNEQRMVLKFSSTPSNYARYRPDLLGTSYLQKVLKDYNGQTYWLSLGIKEFLPKTKLPKWLNLAFGYSGDGMLGGEKNPSFNERGEPLPSFDRAKEYYLSLDVDLRDIKTNKRWLKSVLTTLNFIKIPFPTIGINSDGKLSAKAFQF